jgi:hypothetical protein
MEVGCNEVPPPDREERSSDWVVVASAREIRSRSRLQSRQKESVTETQLKSHQTELSAVESHL